MANWYYYDNNGEKLGPITQEELKDLAAKGIITPQTRLETESGQQGLAGQIKGLNFPVLENPFINPMPIPPQVAPQSNSPATKYCAVCGDAVISTAQTCPRCGSPCGNSGGKSRTVYVLLAALLALFCGGVLCGMHNFYAGRIGIAITQLILGIGIFSVISILTVVTAGIAGVIAVPLYVIWYIIYFIWIVIECVTVTKDSNGQPFV